MRSKILSRRSFIRYTTAAASSLLFSELLPSNLLAQRIPKKKKPNFVFILVDDLGWRDTTCYGSNFYETPNVDRLARQGMRFTDAYAACPVCSPTRASIMTGKYPARLHTTDYFGAAQPEQWRRNTPLLPAHYKDRLPLKEITIAEALKKDGYHTFYAGKWHLGPEGYWPENQGFDVNKGGITRGGPYGGHKYFSPYGNPRLKDGPDGEYLPYRLGRETCKFIKEHKDEPFFAYLAFYSVHTPLMTKKELKAKYKQKAKTINYHGPEFLPEGKRMERQLQKHAVYAGMVQAMDTAVGMVLDTLKKLKLDKNTIVFFMSDNGGLSTSEGSPTANYPLRAGKGWLYEGGIREPMIVKWPGVVKPATICSCPVISTDFYPTILQMAGLPLMPQQHKDGISLVPLLKGAKSLNRKAIFWHYPHYGNQGGSPGSAIRCGDFKLIKFYEDDHVELYNIRKDISEKYDISREFPKITYKLQQMLEDWLQSVDAEMPTPNPNYRDDS